MMFTLEVLGTELWCSQRDEQYRLQITIVQLALLHIPAAGYIHTKEIDSIYSQTSIGSNKKFTWLWAALSVAAAPPRAQSPDVLVA